MSSILIFLNSLVVHIITQVVLGGGEENTSPTSLAVSNNLN